jgi:hypothetical protein
VTQENQQPTQDELLGATTPEALAALMAKAGQSQEGVTDDPEQLQADAAGATGSTDGAAPSTGTENTSGIATKSGTGVLPYSVLQQEREQKGQWRVRATEAEQQRDEATRQLQELQSKVVPDELLSTAMDMTDGELDDLKYINPKAYKAVTLARAMAGTAPAAAPAAAPAPAPAADLAPEAQEARDEAVAAMQGRPLLQRLAQQGGDGWKEAGQLDALLELDAVWGAKPMAERFAEVERRMATKLGIQLAPPAPKPPSTQAPAPAPRQAAEDIPSFRPNTLSDLRSGASPDAADGFSENADGFAMANRFSQMTDAQVAAVIRRAAG